MKNTYCLFLLLFSCFASAQSNIGFISDNYSGVHGVMANPGNIADSRTTADINLYSVSGLLATDYTNLTLSNITDLLGDAGFEGSENFPSNANEFLINAEMLAPSVMLSLGEKQSVALTSRIRILGNFNNIDGQLFESVYDGFSSDNFNFDQSNLDFTTHAWAEIGLTYGRVLLDKNPNHFLKGGVTLKYLLGGGIAQGSSTSLTGSYDSTTEIIDLVGDFEYGSSYEETDDAELFSETSPGFGMDVGFVYEYRTAETMAVSDTQNIRAFNKYKLKIGVSVLDIGSISYKDMEISSYTLDGTISAIEFENDFEAAFDDNFTNTTSRSDVKVQLPTTLKLNIDYFFASKFYLNLDLNQNLTKKDDFFNNNRLNRITLTPRYETRIFGAYLPVSYSSLTKTAMGIGFRLGPLTVGSGSIISNLMSKNAKMANVFAGLKIPINHKRKLKE